MYSSNFKHIGFPNYLNICCNIIFKLSTVYTKSEQAHKTLYQSSEIAGRNSNVIITNA